MTQRPGRHHSPLGGVSLWPVNESADHSCGSVNLPRPLLSSGRRRAGCSTIELRRLCFSDSSSQQASTPSSATLTISSHPFVGDVLVVVVGGTGVIPQSAWLRTNRRPRRRALFPGWPVPSILPVTGLAQPQLSGHLADTSPSVPWTGLDERECRCAVRLAGAS